MKHKRLWQYISDLEATNIELSNDIAKLLKRVKALEQYHIYLLDRVNKLEEAQEPKPGTLLHAPVRSANVGMDCPAVVILLDQISP